MQGRDRLHPAPVSWNAELELTVGAFNAWYLALPQLAQLAIWTAAMLIAAVCCSRKARPIYRSGW